MCLVNSNVVSNTKAMGVTTYRLSDEATVQLDELQVAIGLHDGDKPSKSRVVRMAIANLHKRIVASNQPKEPSSDVANCG